MRLSLSYRDDVKLPSKGTINTLLSVYGMRTPVSLRDIARVTPSLGAARAFLVRAEREGLLIHGAWDRYYVVPPHVAAWSALLLDYYRDLFRMHAALARADVPHAFACLTASTLADYVPGRPIVAVPMEDFDDLSRADVLGIALDADGFRKRAGSIGFKWHDGAFIMNVPALPWDWTALVLGAIGLAREVAAARELLAPREGGIDDAMARRLNAVGLVTRPDVLEKERGVLVPERMLETRGRYAESIRQLELSKG